MTECRPLKLTVKQRADLMWHRDHDFRPYVRERCAAILKVADGQAAYGVARHGLLKERDPDTVYNWLKLYKRDGLEGIVAHQHGGAHRTSKDQSEELLERLRQGPEGDAQKEVMLTPEAPPPSKWTLRTIRVSLVTLNDYSLSGVWRLLQRHDLRLRSSRVQQYSPDPEYLRKEAYLRKCLREAALAPHEIVFLFMDQMAYRRWPDPASNWAPAASDPLLLAERADANNQQWRIIGALNALSGRVHHHDSYIIGREKVIFFYQELHRAYPKAERIYVAQDNWSIHRHPQVTEALKKMPRLKPVWLPTYSPWLNPIEKLWRWLREDVLKMHRLAGDWSKLRQHVNAFLDQFARRSQELLHYVGLLGDGKLAQAARGA